MTFFFVFHNFVCVCARARTRAHARARAHTHTRRPACICICTCRVHKSMWGVFLCHSSAFSSFLETRSLPRSWLFQLCPLVSKPSWSICLSTSSCCRIQTQPLTHAHWSTILTKSSPQFPESIFSSYLTKNILLKHVFTLHITITDAPLVCSIIYPL